MNYPVALSLCDSAVSQKKQAAEVTSKAYGHPIPFRWGNLNVLSPLYPQEGRLVYGGGIGDGCWGLLGLQSLDHGRKMCGARGYKPRAFRRFHIAAEA
jgi:hypothetical protein